MIPKAPLLLRISLGWMAEAWTLMRMCPGWRAGFGSVSRVIVGGEERSGRVSRRACIVAIVDAILWECMEYEYLKKKCFSFHPLPCLPYTPVR